MNQAPKPDLLYSVVIPNWCGGALVRRALWNVAKEARAERRRDAHWSFEIVVCDDASPDGDGARLAEEFAGEEWPELRVIQRDENGGFGPTVNEACAAARGALLCLCNNDLLPQRGYFAALLAPLLDGRDLDDLAEVAGESAPFDGVVATSARTEDAYGRPNHSAMRAAWRGGWPALRWRDRPLPGSGETAPIEAHFFQGGAGAVRTAAWRALGGLDDRFAPGYWEDYDLAHRLRAAGGRVGYTPAARAFHVGSASMKQRFGAKRVRDLEVRNRLLFGLLWGERDATARGQQRHELARQIAREWRRGGPFHRTRALADLDSCLARDAGAASSPATANPESLYPASDDDGFLDVPDEA